MASPVLEADPWGVGGLVVLTDELAFCGNPLPSQIASSKEAGFGSVLNMLVNDPARVQQDREVVEKQGLRFEHLQNGRGLETITAEFQNKFNVLVDELPKPVLVTCNTGSRSAACAFVYLAKKIGGSSQDVLKWGQEAAGKNYAGDAVFYFFLQKYLAKETS